MSRVQANRDKNKPNNHHPPPINIGDAETNQCVQEAENGHNTAQYPKPKPVIYKRVIAFLANNSNQPKVANIISLGMLFVTIVLAVYTYKVFNQTTKQTEIAGKSADAAKISADAAKKSADLQKAALDSQVSAKTKSDIADAIKLKIDTDFINKQKMAIDSQIASMKIHQKEFEIENRPFLQIQHILVDDTKKDFIHASFVIVNTGKQPCRIIMAKISGGCANVPVNYIEKDIPDDVDIEGSYISNYSYMSKAIDSKDTNTDKILVRDINDGSGYIYIFGHIIYQSVAGGKNHEITFYYKITMKPLFNVRAVREDYK